MQNNRVVNIGFIGFGKSANRYHLPYLQIRKNFNVKAIYDLKINENLAKNYPTTKFTTSLEEILQDNDIELITICTPADTHFELAKKVLESGKHVIVEKPFCVTALQAKKLFILAKQRNLLIQPYQNRRFDSDYLVVKKVIEQGLLGNILEIESHINYFRPGSITNKNVKENGSFYGLGIHLLDRMLAIFSRPQTVVYDIRNNEVADASDNYFDVDLHYSHSLKIKLKVNHIVADNYPRFKVVGSNGTFTKYGEDQQENDLKSGIIPGSENFGEDEPQNFGFIKYKNQNGDWIERYIKTPIGDYGKFYDAIYETLIFNKKPLISEIEAISNIEILEKGFLKSKNGGTSIVHLEAISE